MTIEQTVDIPVSHRLDLHLDIPPEFPTGRTILSFTPASSDLFAVDKAEGRAKSRAARQKLRELCKDSTLTVDSFLAMKHADRVLEASAAMSIDECAKSNAP
ncbi:hypothetical protein FACS1894137_09120 [Spirochaetia bacterium]|nr:hypothetical protein FACS1894137_09120 [Spirochaetia bacterium]